MADIDAVVDATAEWLRTNLCACPTDDGGCSDAVGDGPGPSPQWHIPVECVFPAFGGVLCIALRGFPHAVPLLKRHLTSALDGEAGRVGLSPENLGSMWPKVTVAAPSATASRDAADWDRLRRSLLSFHLATDMHLSFDTVTLVAFQNRTLERRRDVANVSTACVDAAAHHATARGGFDAPSDHPGCGDAFDNASASRVRSIVHEYLDEATWPEYRDQGIVQRMQCYDAYHNDATPGATLVSFVAAAGPLAAMLAALKAHLEGCGCGGMYEWMPGATLHMTLRGLC